MRLDVGIGRCIQFTVKAIRNLPHHLETLLIPTYTLPNDTSECTTLPGWKLGCVPLCQRAGRIVSQMKSFCPVDSAEIPTCVLYKGIQTCHVSPAIAVLQ